MQELWRSRRRRALQAIELVQTTMLREHMENQCTEVLRVQNMLMETLGAFRPHPRIDTFMSQLDMQNYGRRHRFKLLGLFGGSHTCKSSKALSLLGMQSTLQVSCQGLGCLSSHPWAG